MSDQIQLIAPDDWHVHLRDGEMLSQVVPYTAQMFRRAIVMPNLRPPVVTVEAAKVYRAGRQRLSSQLAGASWQVGQPANLAGWQIRQPPIC